MRAVSDRQAFLPSAQLVAQPADPIHTDVNVLPNEETRVRLAQIGDDATSTFINANYVRGFKGFPKRYIATQGPLPDTMNDFWCVLLTGSRRRVEMLLLSQTCCLF